ncbi:MAG TPA: serine hydrolase domain-containing protein [Cyclobacteriaceae bacterium]|nr:serine hydrolase domain-containing protein [Cyclobacteriaceae bacterium]
MIRILSVCAVALCIASCAPKQEGASGTINEAAKARIDSTLKAMVDASRIAGASALIVENDKEVYFNSFGFADREAQKPFDRNTIVRIFSMTKPITGVALMQLYEKGLFQLDDPLSKYAPEFTDMKVYGGKDAKGKMILNAPKRPITVRDITRHTAGFPNGDHPDLGPLVREADVMNKENTLTQMAAKLSTLPLAFSPGDQWSYGVCVDVQAYLVEKLSGKPFDQYVRENVLDPLKMNSTRYVPVDMNRFSAGYSRADTTQLVRIPDSLANLFNSKDWPLKPGGFGLTSTIDDYMRFARMLVHEGTFEGVTILKPETVKLMATNQLADSIKQRMWLPSKGPVGFGIDFAVRLRDPINAEEKNGVTGEFFWDGAASTLFWVDPKNKMTVVLFVQILPFSNPLHKAFRDAVYGKWKGK